MTADLPLPTPLQYFAALVADDTAFPLLEAAASLAQDEYPEMDVQQVLNEVDRLLDRLKRRLPDEADPDPLQRLRALNQLFYRDLGFGGNVNHYHDPDNSYLHVLLGTRRGIPVSLAVLWMELAQGVGLDARGVSFPACSISKHVAAFGTLRLVADATIDLDADVNTYLSSWQLPGAGTVTVRQLLSHTAGLTDGLGFGDYRLDEPLPTLEEALTAPRASMGRATAPITVGIEPGTRFQYSGGGYLVLELLVEEVAGSS